MKRLFFFTLMICFLCNWVDAQKLPDIDLNDKVYDACIVNDNGRDVLLQYHLMSLANDGMINLVGIIMCDDDEPRYKWAEEILQMGHNEGWKNLPSHVKIGPPRFGTDINTDNPSNSKFKGSPGTKALYQLAKDRSPNDPLIVINGGPLTVLADALLYSLEQDNSIANNMFVYHIFMGTPSMGSHGFNEDGDPGAFSICMQNLRMILETTVWRCICQEKGKPCAVCDESKNNDAIPVGKEWWKNNMDLENQVYAAALEAIKDGWSCVECIAADAAHMAAYRPDYLEDINRCSYSGQNGAYPNWKLDPNGHIWHAGDANRYNKENGMTVEAYWKALMKGEIEPPGHSILHP
jgi:hypothetical protein